jgi:[amino group carrier protein]-lysine/ornithine hydrolase
LLATFRGRRSHYASPVPTATDVALEWVGAVRALVAAHRSDSPFRSLTAKVLSVESRRSGDAETTRVTVDFRLPPGMSTARLDQLIPTEPGRRSVTARIRAEPVEVDRGNPVVRALSDAIRSAGARPTLWRKSGTSDLNVVDPLWRIPAAAYGPGDARLDHTARESLSDRELGRSVTILEEAFRALARDPRIRRSRRRA